VLLFVRDLFVDLHCRELSGNPFDAFWDYSHLAPDYNDYSELLEQMPSVLVDIGEIQPRLHQGQSTGVAGSSSSSSALAPQSMMVAGAVFASSSSSAPVDFPDFHALMQQMALFKWEFDRSESDLQVAQEALRERDAQLTEAQAVIAAAVQRPWFDRFRDAENDAAQSVLRTSLNAIRSGTSFVNP